eukprot:symbB.v1.2.041268.t1/scaffold7995.1/size8281/1
MRILGWLAGDAGFYGMVAFWLYLFVMGLHSGWHWSTTWKGHSSNSATLGALKTVGFGIFDLLACLALKASREAYRSKRLQDILEEAPLEVESLAKKCCFLGLLQAAVQALYWILFIYCMAQRDREDCHLAKLWLTSIGATGTVPPIHGVGLRKSDIVVIPSSLSTRPWCYL